jgi:amidase
LKPSLGRVSWGPILDELGYGVVQNFVQVKTVRDAAAMLDCLAVPQPGDPFVIPKPDESYAALIKRTPGRLRTGWSTEPLMGMEADAGVCSAIARVAQVLAGMGHDVAEESPQFGGLDALRSRPTSSNYDVTADGKRFLMVKDDDQDSATSMQIGWADEVRRRSGAG